MHRLCKHGGLIIITQNLWGGNGYYCYDKPFFEGIAAANNYKILFDSYIIAPDKKTRSGSDLEFHIPMNRDLLNTINITNVKTIAVHAVMQKQTKADFQFPYQDLFLSEQQGHLGFNRLFYRDPPSYSYIPSVNPPGKLLLRMLIQKIKRKAFSILSR